MAWLRIDKQGRRQGFHEHDYRAQHVGAGLSRKICETCGHISLSAVPMKCWARTDAGVHCQAYSLRVDVGPVCWNHARASIDWRQAVLDSVAIRSQPPKPIVGPGIVIQLDPERRSAEVKSQSRLVLTSG